MKLAYDFYENMPYEQYDLADAIRFSNLKHLERSPMAYQYHLGHPSEPTEPQMLGYAAHLAILEPATAKFAIWDGGTRRGKVFDEWANNNSGSTQLNVKEAEHVFGMATAVHDNPIAHKYLRYGRSELTMVWRDLTFKRDFKARIDKQCEVDGEPYLVSLKTTTDCRDFKFGAQYATLGYAAQDAIYQSGFYCLTGTLPKMVTVAVENTPPFDSTVYAIPTDVLRIGQQLATKWVQRLTECERSNRWPGAFEGEQDLSLPSWAIPGGDFEFDDLEVLP